MSCGDENDTFTTINIPLLVQYALNIATHSLYSLVVQIITLADRHMLVTVCIHTYVSHCR